MELAIHWLAEGHATSHMSADSAKLGRSCWPWAGRAEPSLLKRGKRRELDRVQIQLGQQTIVGLQSARGRRSLLARADDGAPRRRCGLQRGEIVSLRQADVDLRHGQLRVRLATWRGIEDSPKGGRERIIPMTEALMVALSANRHLRGPRVLHQGDGKPVDENVLQDWMGAHRRRPFRSWRDTRTSARRSATCTSARPRARAPSSSSTSRQVRLFRQVRLLEISWRRPPR